MTVRIAIDPNIRLPGNQTFAGFEDVQRFPIHVGMEVEVYEEESGVHGHGSVASIDEERELVYLNVEWSSLAYPENGPAAPSGDAVEVRNARVTPSFGEGLLVGSRADALTDLAR